MTTSGTTSAVNEPVTLTPIGPTPARSPASLPWFGCFGPIDGANDLQLDIFLGESDQALPHAAAGAVDGDFGFHLVPLFSRRGGLKTSHEYGMFGRCDSLVGNLVQAADVVFDQHLRVQPQSRQYFAPVNTVR